MVPSAGWPQRESMRLREWDYRSPVAYFITITTRWGCHYFGRNDEGRLKPSAAGLMVAEVWRQIPARFPAVGLDSFIVMPNHLHGIVRIGAAPRALRPELGEILMAFKSLTTVAYIRGVRDAGWPPFQGRLWHRNYHDRIIWTPLALARIRSYIEANPRIHARRLRRRQR